jgi:hypothetical protein
MDHFVTGNLRGQKCPAVGKFQVREFHEPVPCNAPYPFIVHNARIYSILLFVAWSERCRDDLGQLRLRLRLVSLVVVGHHRDDGFVPAEVPDLVEAHARFLTLRNRDRNPMRFCSVAPDFRPPESIPTFASRGTWVLRSPNSWSGDPRSYLVALRLTVACDPEHAHKFTAKPRIGKFCEQCSQLERGTVLDRNRRKVPRHACVVLVGERRVLLGQFHI